jgi:1-phosphofructokinase family hexose kinase
MKILCVTPNVSVDRTLTVPGFAAGAVWRAASVTATCGGKGVNVARAVAGLGHRAVCTGLLAGHSGRLAAGSAKAESLDAAWTWIDGETRTCVIVVGDAGEATVINEPGTAVSDGDWVRFVADVAVAAEGADTVCIAGSLPPGCPPGGLARLVATAGAAAARPVWVDTSGPVLAEAVAVGAAIKINAPEAAALLGRAVATVADALDAAIEIRGRGAGVTAITLGGDGAVLVTGDGAWRARPPAIAVVSAVGSGDCFLAGLAAGLAEARRPEEALRLAVAAGTANALRTSAGSLDSGDLGRILRATDTGRLR